MAIILVDVGGVLVKADSNITLRHLQGLGVHPDQAKLFFFNQEGGLGKPYEDFAIGKITPREFARQLRLTGVVSKLLRRPLTQTEFRKAHDSHIYAPMEGMPELLAALSKEHKLAIATDTNAWQTQKVRQLVKEIGGFIKRKQYFSSNKLGMMKSDSQFFAKVLEKMKVDPRNEDVFLIDDSKNKLAAAEKVGITPILFESPKQLHSELKSRRLL